MQSFMTSGLLFEIVAALTVIEGLVLLWLYGYRRSGIPPVQILPMLAAGFCLMMTVRGVALDLNWSSVLPWFMGALIAHLADLAIRWRR